MSLLGYDNNDKTLSGDADVYATNLYATNIYDNGVDVGATLITLQAEIDALEGQIVSSGTTGYYAVYGSTNNPTNTLAERVLFFNQTIAQNGFTLITPSGGVASRITATYSGVYTIYYKVNYQKVNATTSYDIRTWLMKNGVDVNFSTTIHTFPTTALYFQASGQFTISLAAGDYLEVVWYSPTANASSDILDYQASVAPYPQVSSQFVCIQQVANTDTGIGVVFEVASTTTLPAGSAATITDTTTTYPTYINHSLAFGIPQGLQGVNGTNGTNGAKGDKGINTSINRTNNGSRNRRRISSNKRRSRRTRFINRHITSRNGYSTNRYISITSKNNRPVIHSTFRHRFRKNNTSSRFRNRRLCGSIRV